MDAESIQSTERMLENLELCELFILTVLEVSVYLALKILKTKINKNNFFALAVMLFPCYFSVSNCMPPLLASASFHHP